MLSRFFARTIDVSAHCDLPCGVYDPAQARIEAQSVKAIAEKLAAFPQLHQLINDATKLAGAAGTKGKSDVETADQLLAKIDEIAEIFAETKKAA